MDYFILILANKYLLIFSSCYFGQMSRSESHDLLMAEKENGTYLIRDSLSIPGYYVLSLK